MIRKKVHSPILFFLVLLIVCSCRKEAIGNADDYNALRLKAYNTYSKMQFDSAYFYYSKIKESLSDSTDLRRTYALYCMADIQQLLGDYYGCEETVTEALANEKDSIYKPYLYNILAVAHDKQKNLDQAISYYKKSIRISRDDTLKAVTKNNIGVVFLERKEYQKAIQILQPLLSNPFLKNDKKKNEIARVMDNLGYAQFKINHPDAYSNLLSSWKIRDSISDKVGMIASNMHLAEYFLDKNKDQAQKYGIQALESAKNANSPDDELEALLHLTEINGLADADHYFRAYSKLNDSLEISRSGTENKYFKYKYDSTTTLKNLEIQKGQKLVFLMLFVFSLLLGTLLYFLIRNRNRNKLKTIVYDTETHISKRLHDELANDVYHTMTFAETQDLQDAVKKEALIENLDKIYSRTRNISKENSGIQTGEGFEDGLKEMLMSYSGENVNVIIKPDPAIQWSRVAADKKIAAHRVLQELMVNMKKHSHAAHVMIAFEQRGNDIAISYTDNGVGCQLPSKTKNGLHNAENRMEAIQGKLTFESEPGKGFRAKIIFPK